MTYEGEEPEIFSVLPGTGWQAVIGGQSVPLVVWAALDSGRLYGVVVGADGLIDLTTGNVEERSGFTGYAQTTNDRSK